MVKDVDGALEYIKAQSLGFADEEVARAWAEAGTTLTGFLDDHGVNYLVRDDQPGADFPNFPGADSLCAIQISDPDNPAAVRGGGYYLRTMIPLFIDGGGELLTDTRATDLVQDESGAIIGVKALQGGAETTIRAKKAVIPGLRRIRGQRAHDVRLHAHLPPRWNVVAAQHWRRARHVPEGRRRPVAYEQLLCPRVRVPLPPGFFSCAPA